MFKLEGRRLGRYRVGERLGQGGMGAVFSARAEGSAEEVAIKLLYGPFTQDPEFLDRLRQEAQVIASLEDRRIVRLLEFGEEPELGPYLVMERAAGRDLRRLLAAEGPLALPRALDLAAQVADALAHAHDREVVHRDIKPENLMVDDQDRVVVTDFGIARAAGSSRLTRTGFVPGTPEYMAPEQLAPGPIDSRADLYALGVVVYEMLTGRTPFHSENVAEVIHRQAYQLPAPPSALRAEVPEELDRLVLACLAKSPEGRPASARELAAELRRVAQLPPRPPVPAPLPTLQVALLEVAPARPTPLRFLPAVLAMGALVLLALAWQRFLQPPSWYEDGTGVAPAPLVRVLTGAATLHGAEVALFAPDRSLSGLERARACSNTLTSLLRQGPPGPLEGRRDGREWVVATEGGTEVFRVDRATAAHLGASPELVGAWWGALLQDHLDLREGLEPEHTLAFERKHPLRPRGERPVGPLFDRIYLRARHQVEEGPLPTAALLQALESLDGEDRQAFREAARLVPRELPPGTRPK